MVETACAEDSFPLRLRQWYDAFLAVAAFSPSHRWLQAGRAVLSLPCVRNSTTILARCLLLRVWAIISQSSIRHCRDVSDASFESGSKHTAWVPTSLGQCCSHGKMYRTLKGTYRGLGFRGLGFRGIFSCGSNLAGKQEVSDIVNKDALVPPPHPKPKTLNPCKVRLSSPLGYTQMGMLEFTQSIPQVGKEYPWTGFDHLKGRAQVPSCLAPPCLLCTNMAPSSRNGRPLGLPAKGLVIPFCA